MAALIVSPEYGVFELPEFLLVDSRVGDHRFLAGLMQKFRDEWIVESKEEWRGTFGDWLVDTKSFVERETVWLT